MIRGKAIALGNHIDTDAIIPAKYCTSIDMEFLGMHLLETHDPAPSAKSFRGKIIVAGTNFGCGSAREHAALAILGAGVVAVVARSFSRTFFRNAVNIALPVVELSQSEQIQTGDVLEIDLDGLVLRNQSNKREYALAPYPAIIRTIMEAGGMIEFTRRRLAWKRNTAE